MPQEIFPPKCMLDAVGVLLPTIEYWRVRYYVGFETGMDQGQAARTMQYGNLQNIYFRPNWDPTLPCEQADPFKGTPAAPSEFARFVNFVHEHVHVLQIQHLAGGGNIGGSWATSYLTCWFASGFDSEGPNNCFEQEAYVYANRQDPVTGQYIGLVAAALFAGTLIMPCSCGRFGIPQPGNMPLFRAQVKALGLEKTTTSCTMGDCLAELSTKIPVLGLVWAAVSLLVGLLFGFLSAINALSGLGIPLIATGAAIGLAMGFFEGGTLGLLIGSAFGTLAGLALGVLLGVFFGFLGALLGAALGGLIASILNSIIDFLTGGDSGGGLNLEMSTDLGSTFGPKYTFERTREQVALATVGQRLWVGWTGLDAQVNVRVVDNTLPAPSTFKLSFEQSNHCGPAIAAYPNGDLFVVWVGTDGHLNTQNVAISVTITPSGDKHVSLDLGTKFTLWDAKSPADATPGLAVDNYSNFFLAWVEDPNDAGPAHVHLWNSVDGGITWNDAAFLGDILTTKTGTAALAFADGQLHLSWASPDGIIHTVPFDVDPAGSGAVTRLGITDVLATGPSGTAAGSATKGGPAVAAGNGKLFIGWTDPHQAIHLAESTTSGFFDHRFDPEVSRPNAGPGLAFEEAPIVADTALLFAWTGAD